MDLAIQIALGIILAPIIFYAAMIFIAITWAFMRELFNVFFG